MNAVILNKVQLCIQFEPIAPLGSPWPKAKLSSGQGDYRQRCLARWRDYKFYVS